MSIPARGRMIMALDGHTTHAKFCTRFELAPSMLTVAVDGVGPLKYPIGPKRAGELIALAGPASYGRGESTLTNPAVRNTWEVPKQLVQAQWAQGSLEAALDAVREGLGLPSEGELHAEPHSVLVYEKGQFFLPHQDSEKHDDMIGTLVVTLPSRFQGGELVVKHGEATEVCGGSPEKISIAAFYGDCHHEVTRVRSGYRITLTYNLLYQGGTQPPNTSGDPRIGQLTQLLDEHFQTPVAEPYSRKPAAPPQRLAFLLDHEYTEKNLAWHRLKGEDARYAALLRTAADAADCQTMLGLNEIQETWDAYPAGENDDYFDDEEEGSDEEEYDGEYELNDLIESSIRLVHWVDPDTGEAEKISLDISPTELCTRTAHPPIEPYEQSYEGYMGNYGNTLDRWYRRAALIIWPRRLEFANRAESSPGWGLKRLQASAHAGQVVQARELARTLAPFWHGAIEDDAPAAWLTSALTTARLLDDPEIAAMLLAPFAIRHLRAAHISPLAAAAEAYGPAWTEQLVDTWTRDTRPGGYAHLPADAEWVKRLPDLCGRLHRTGTAGDTVVSALLARTWQALSSTIDSALTYQKPPSRRTAALVQTGPGLASLLCAAEHADAGALSEEVLAHLTVLVPEATSLVLTVLGELDVLPPSERAERTYARIAEECSRRLRAELAAPTRAAGDWSISLSDECACALCHELAAFLTSPDRTTLTWPLVQRDRQHIHTRIDGAELPVTHTTLREGRPHKLVLTKTDALFTREREHRTTAQAVLAWIEGPG
ncbi:MAG TPA: 2OG-Fe(II) oxygenase [Actinocrinis sp.]|nr:2OG-Fe(II) oxygenase [Actinocrinis sp.]